MGLILNFFELQGGTLDVGRTEKEKKQDQESIIYLRKLFNQKSEQAEKYLSYNEQ